MTGFRIEDYAVNRPNGRCVELADRFEALLGACSGENELQEFLKENPIILSQQLPHCHHVVPKPRLGGEYVPDFVLPEMHSGGTDWYLVELEPAIGSLVTKGGQFGERVRIAIQQIRDWRSWLAQNLNYAARPLSEQGLGFEGIDSRPYGWVVAGRRKDVTNRFNQLRKQIQQSDQIEVMTYDRLLDWYRKRALFWDEWDKSGPKVMVNSA